MSGSRIARVAGTMTRIASSVRRSLAEFVATLAIALEHCCSWQRAECIRRRRAIRAARERERERIRLRAAETGCEGEH